MNTNETPAGLSVAGGSAGSDMDRRAAAIHRVFHALNTGDDLDRTDVELAMDEIIALRKEREKQAATIRHMEAQIDAYEEDAIP